MAGALVAAAAIGTGLVATASGHATAVDPDTYLSPLDIAAIRSEAVEARRAGLRAAEEGRRVAEEARSEGLRERAVAPRAARARADARLEAVQGRDEALAASREAMTAKRIAYWESDEGARDRGDAQVDRRALRRAGQTGLR